MPARPIVLLGSERVWAASKTPESSMLHIRWQRRPVARRRRPSGHLGKRHAQDHEDRHPRGHRPERGFDAEYDYHGDARGYRPGGGDGPTLTLPVPRRDR